MTKNNFALACLGWLWVVFAQPAHAHLPNHANFELLPMTLSASHIRGMGFGFSLERLSDEDETLIALSTEVSFPLMQQRDASSRMDWNGAIAFMGALKPTLYMGAKVGASLNPIGGPIGFYALSLRILPRDHSGFGFFQWVEKQIDIGIFGDKNLYAAVRLGFSLF